jgi:hypothetical protein
MRRLLAVLASTAALGTALLALPGSAAAGNCGNFAGSAVIATGDVPCRKAKAIVKEYLKLRKPDIQGWDCKGSSSSVYCSTPGKSIRWRK